MTNKGNLNTKVNVFKDFVQNFFVFVLTPIFQAF